MKMLIPKEHGAWAMLFAPLLIGMSASRPGLYHIPLFLSMLAVYLASNPLVKWSKNPRRNPELKPWIAGYGMAAIGLGLPLLFKYEQLLCYVLPAVSLLLINIGFARHKKERHLLNDLASIGGLSLGGVAAYYVGIHSITLTAWIIWLSCLLLFFGSALHVKSLIRQKGNRIVKRTANLYHLILVLLPITAPLAIPALSPYVWMSLAFLFSAVKVWATPCNASFRILTIGVIEIVNSIWFVIVASIVLS